MVAEDRQRTWTLRRIAGSALRLLAVLAEKPGVTAGSIVARNGMTAAAVNGCPRALSWDCP